MAKSECPTIFAVIEEEQDDEEETICLLPVEEEEGGGGSEPPRGCFPAFPCFTSTRESRAGGRAATWSATAAKREEVAAGNSNWKTNLVRRFLSFFTMKKKKIGAFHYDSTEYALNFDDEEEQERFVRGFAIRFAPSPNIRNSKPIKN